MTTRVEIVDGKPVEVSTNRRREIYAALDLLRMACGYEGDDMAGYNLFEVLAKAVPNVARTMNDAFDEMDRTGTCWLASEDNLLADEIARIVAEGAK